MTQPDPSTALLLEALVSRGDPLTRFVDSLPDEPPFLLRTFARETMRLRQEFQINATRLLTETDERQVAGYAAWLAKNAHEVGYRWAALRSAAVRWSMLDGDAMAFRVGATREGGAP